MAGLFDQIERQKTLDENAGVALAAGRATWANQFNSIPPVEKLRANLDLTTAIDTALRRKQELLAREDLKAQELLHREKKFEQWQADAPLRTELLKRKVATEGEHERFIQQKDAEALGDLSGFLGAVGKLKAKPGSPEYKAALAAALQAHPRAIGTQVGADAWKKLSAEHEDIAAITPPAGMEVDRIDIGDDGRAKAVFKPVQPASQVQVPEGMVPSGATVNKRGDVSVNYATPKTEKDSPELRTLERERKFYQDNLARAEARRNAAKDDDTKKLFDEDIREYKAKRDEAESQLRSFREGNAQPGAAAEAPAGPVKVASADDFAKLPSGAEFIDPQGVKRRKP